MLKREHKVSNISSEAIFAIPAMKPSRVIFASTSEVYGSTIDNSALGASLSEDSHSHSSLLSPRTPYSVSKKMGEEIVRSFARKGNSGCSIRFFNVVVCWFLVF